MRITNGDVMILLNESFKTLQKYAKKLKFSLNLLEVSDGKFLIRRMKSDLRQFLTFRKKFRFLQPELFNFKFNNLES